MLRQLRARPLDRYSVRTQNYVFTCRNTHEGSCRLVSAILLRLPLDLFSFIRAVFVLQTTALVAPVFFFSPLPQVEHVARRGGFGSVPRVHLHAAQKSLDLIMTATWRPSAHVAQHPESQDHHERGLADAPLAPTPGRAQFVASCRLRVTAKVQPG